ncbi:unnamed protein product [Clonostachys rosea f. rosea IK726]|jgi:peroxiredoxin|uniref:thioredoxin-dependent peroxiredoxin n=4 Tax=Bionectria ochroleuca TaxID=29856 RepID=A0A0B7K7J1_BIOOC|nr:unnamed protein product [Clonostachys rosea f. rosea IK726]CAG9949507.1 unnamed protein product [Clonostachys rosea f. rosea IK726]CAG9949510.1 unnamed protein product [Clonostachys rosea f. rosea IK726]
MSQSEKLEAIASQAKNIPGIEPVIKALEDFIQDFKPESAVQIGDKFPSFSLTDATGKQVSSEDLLAKGPLLITFYRGQWCPYCNVALQFLQRHLDEFAARGVTLVALTPELPDKSLSTTEKNELKFPVLTDLGNGVARKLGLIYNQSAAREFYAEHGINLKEHNGDDSFEVPVPATLLVDGSGIVRQKYVEADFRKRIEPKLALEWIDSL